MGVGTWVFVRAGKGERLPGAMCGKSALQSSWEERETTEGLGGIRSEF